MRKFAIPVATVLLLCGVQPRAQQPGPPRTGTADADPIKSAAETLGATGLKSVRFVGLGASFSVGQSPNPGEPWPRVTIKNYDASINYDAASMRVELSREQGAIPPRGGGLPFIGEQRVIEFVSGADAWNVPLVPPTVPPAAPGAPAPVVPLVNGRPRFLEQAPVPQRPAAIERTQQIWLTPHGFLRAAMANAAKTRAVAGGTEVSFSMGSTTFTGFINRRNQVERVRTSIANAMLGEMPLEVSYSDYERVDGGVSFPMRIIQKQGGYPSLDLWISAVQPNVPVEIATPDAVRSAAGGTAPAVRVDIQKIADGVHYLTGGSHHSVAIEMRDHVVLVEAPLDAERSRAVIAKISEAIPGKPIRFVINTHHHFDHAGGLRPYADLGATIVTHEMNRAYYEKIWGKPAAFQTFTDKSVLTDGARTIEVHRIANSPHGDAFAMVYLPAEKILIEADAYTPPAIVPPAATTSGTAPPAPPPFPGPPISPTTLNLYDNIRRLKLDVVTIAALHGPHLATLEDLARAAGQ